MMKVIAFEPTTISGLDLAELREGIGKGISKAVGACLAEAASVSLERQNHSPGKVMDIAGAVSHSVSVHWDASSDKQRVASSWTDADVAAEWGACGIAALLVEYCTDCTIVERSRKGTGFDYWLGRKDAATGNVLFQNAGRLEVSGINKGSSSTVNQRVKRKEQQVLAHGKTMPSLVAIVEFGRPVVHVTSHERD